MDLTELAGSPAPNAFAVLCVVALLVVGFVKRDQMRWGFVLPCLAVTATVVGKNLSYSTLVARAEGSMMAHHNYAEALVMAITVLVATGIGLLFLTVFANRARWFAALAAGATGYAAACMMGWWRAYAMSDATKPVRYELWGPASSHWVALAGLTIALVMAVISLARRRRRVTP